MRLATLTLAALLAGCGTFDRGGHAIEYSLRYHEYANNGDEIMRYEHKGIEIEFDAGSEQFSARIDGKLKRSASLDAIKKQIDKRETFQTFPALIEPRYRKNSESPFIEVRVIGIKKGRGRYKSDEWEIENRSAEFRVYADTPENRKLLQERADMRERHIAEKERMIAEGAALDEKLVTLRPESL